jgi:hypothetical protein
MLRNCWLRDERTSLKAKGLLGYLMSHAEGYKISQAQIIRQNDDGREAVRSGLDELESAGYLTRTRQRSSGRYAEDDYALADPFDEAGKLLPTGARETGQLTAFDTQETRQSGKTDTAHPTREIAPIEEQGENTTPAPTEQGASNDRHLRSVDADAAADAEIASVAQAVAAEHYEATGKLGGSRAFLALRGIVAGALRSGHAPEQIRPALAHLRSRGRSVTNSTLGPLLADPRTVTRSGYGPAYREDTLPPDAHRGAF